MTFKVGQEYRGKQNKNLIAKVSETSNDGSDATLELRILNTEVQDTSYIDFPQFIPNWDLIVPSYQPHQLKDGKWAVKISTEIAEPHLHGDFDTEELAAQWIASRAEG